jgi:hypothetical protein
MPLRGDPLTAPVRASLPMPSMEQSLNRVYAWLTRICGEESLFWNGPVGKRSGIEKPAPARRF